jgi:hypothetical protein
MNMKYENESIIHNECFTMMNSTSTTEDIAETMECGTSLAEEIWVLPSTAMAPSSSLSESLSSDSASASAATSKSKASSASASATATVEEAWSNIHQLRSRLAADVISDPPSLSSPGSSGSDFPTFISPFERPRSNDGGKTTTGTAKSSTGTTTTINNNSSYQGMSIPLIYCDQTASQRPVRSIEDYIRTVSMPCYANTHTVGVWIYIDMISEC